MHIEAVKQVFRPLKRGLSRAFDFKSGIMLSRSVPARKSYVSAVAGQSGVELRRVDAFRPDLPVSAMQFHLRQESGNHLFELLVDERPVCFGWVASGGTRIGVLHHLSLSVPENAFYIWDCITPRSFRGNGYFQQLLGHILLRHPAGATALVAVDYRNAASRAALGRAGFTPEFTYVSARACGYRCLSFAINRGRIQAAQPSFDAFSQRILAT